MGLRRKALSSESCTHAGAIPGNPCLSWHPDLSLLSCGMNWGRPRRKAELRRAGGHAGAGSHNWLRWASRSQPDSEEEGQWSCEHGSLRGVGPRVRADSALTAEAQLALRSPAVLETSGWELGRLGGSYLNKLSRKRLLAGGLGLPTCQVVKLLQETLSLNVGGGRRGGKRRHRENDGCQGKTHLFRVT